MRALIDGNASYQNIRVIRVDWDMHRDDRIVSELNIPRRSTLVMFNNGEEVGRVVAQTTAAQIEPMFEAATES